MAGRRIDTMDLRELIRHIQQTPSDRAVQEPPALTAVPFNITANGPRTTRC